MSDEFVGNASGGDEAGSEGDVLKGAVVAALNAVKEQPFG